MREVIFVEGAALGAKAETVILHFEEGDGVTLPGDRFVENEDAGLHPGVGIETASREGPDCLLYFLCYIFREGNYGQEKETEDDKNL